MHVAVLSNAVAGSASADEQDVLVQVEAVSRALERLGHRVECWSCTLNLDELAERLRRAPPEVVFNLVEALGGSDRLSPAVPLLLDAFEVPYTGSPTPALLAAAGKIATKERLHAAGLPTPAWLAAGSGRGDGSADRARGAAASFTTRRVILKPVWEHASLGMDDSAVVSVTSPEQLRQRVDDWSQRLGRPCFAEDYVDGREFNLSVLAGPAGSNGPEGPQVLPPAEIDFSAFPPDKPRIVGYRAKWEAGSFEYEHTPRRFDFPPSEGRLLDRLGDLALRAWTVFGLAGYARVDFRVDRDGEPWILEINANPCLSPDAGFAAALAPAGLSFDQAIERIVEAACEA